MPKGIVEKFNFTQERPLSLYMPSLTPEEIFNERQKKTRGGMNYYSGSLDETNWDEISQSYIPSNSLLSKRLLGQISRAKNELAKIESHS